jgi:hypothetical protein
VLNVYVNVADLSHLFALQNGGRGQERLTFRVLLNDSIVAGDFFLALIVDIKVYFSLLCQRSVNRFNLGIEKDHQSQLSLFSYTRTLSSLVIGCPRSQVIIR